ncbi:isopenicillin N synthase family dioxygenase [Streptomyces sp. NPDC004111]|uniref:isopenicillin N synthase family dioxygenase n=1 Tax=Streptomyces sp. NPDC004111 TaxID=3364690 RepID=UPI0036BE9C5E
MNQHVDAEGPLALVTVVDGYVPVIDLSAAGTDPGREAVAQAIGRACETSGFFVVVGHGVPQALIDRMYATTKAFFALPRQEREKAVGGPDTCGLRPSAGSAAKSMGLDAPPDLCDVFTANALGEYDTDRRRAEGGGDTSAPWVRANLWPAEPVDLKSTWLAYLRAMESLGRQLMELFGLALGLGADFFDDKVDRHISTIVANYYYPQTAPALPGQLRKGAHTDWGNVTVLYQDAVGGLQVRHDAPAAHEDQQGSPGGEDDGWRDVPFVPGSFVINIGDMMQFWTGGHWSSTLHRVVNPAQHDGRSRLSLPYFFMPNHDARVEPITGLRGSRPMDPDKCVTTPGRWYREMMAATYA